MNNEIKNYNSFDVGKFICSILVMMIHISPFGNREINSIFEIIEFSLRNGICRIAVPLFFVFNGYFLHKKIVDGNAKKYLIHILKLYLWWTLIYFPLNFIRIKNSSGELCFDIVMYVKSIICSGSYYHLWYLNALAVVVAIIAFLTYKKWSPKKMLCVSFAFYLIGLLGDGYFRLISPLFSIKYVKEIVSLYFAIFDTTRNGLFFGFLFVTLGMYFADKKIEIDRKKSMMLFIISIFMICVEAFCVMHFGLVRDYNVLLLCCPAAIFGFLFLKTINLKDNSVYIMLRKMSSLIFYIHPLIIYIYLKCSEKFEFGISGTPFPFLIVLTISILVAISVIKISNKKGFGWLKKIY